MLQTLNAANIKITTQPKAGITMKQIIISSIPKDTVTIQMKHGFLVSLEKASTCNKDLL